MSAHLHLKEYFVVMRMLVETSCKNLRLEKSLCRVVAKRRLPAKFAG